jgi:hypothetical protein
MPRAGRDAFPALPDQLEKFPLTAIDTSMQTPSFHAWLEHRPQQVPDSTTLAILIARAGAAGGISFHDLRRQSRLLPDVLQSLLAALTAAGQVMVVSVGGQLRYRAVG